MSTPAISPKARYWVSHGPPPSHPGTFALSMMSCAVFPEGIAFTIISCVMGNDSLFEKLICKLPDGIVPGIPWNRNFWANTL